MASKQTVRERIINAAFELAADKGWSRVRLADIAAEANVTLGKLYAEFPSKQAIVGGFLTDIDKQVLSAKTDQGDSVRDRLFDVIMRRFDALAPYRRGLRSVMRHGMADPVAAMCLVPRFKRSMVWMLEAAGVDTTGLCGAAKVRGLGLVYLQAFRVWLDDDTADMGHTMAAVDRLLRRAESAAALCSRAPKLRPAETEAPAAG